MGKNVCNPNGRQSHGVTEIYILYLPVFLYQATLLALNLNNFTVGTYFPRGMEKNQHLHLYASTKFEILMRKH